MSIISQLYKSLIKSLNRIFKRNNGNYNDLDIILYKGYGNTYTVFVSGMVTLESKVNTKDNKWNNMLTMINRFTQTTVPHKEVEITIQGVKSRVVTDESGFFLLEFKVPFPDQIKGMRWIPMLASLPAEKVVVGGEIQIVTDKDDVIFVSDIDDTILISHSTQLLRKLNLILFKNAESRLFFPDIPRFYNQLKAGRNKQQDNPFFYVSSSEWNLYDLLSDFFSFNHIPKGTFLLKKYSEGLIKLWLSGESNHDQKYDKIKFLLQLYSKQNFVLLGDNGQEDPYIYGRLSKEFPGRIETCYIRQIKSIRSLKTNQVNNLFDVNTTLIQIKHTSEAITHAKKKGYV